MTPELYERVIISVESIVILAFSWFILDCIDFIYCVLKGKKPQ